MAEDVIGTGKGYGEQNDNLDLLVIARRVVDLLPRKTAMPDLTPEERSTMSALLARLDEVLTPADFEPAREMFRAYGRRTGVTIATSAEFKVLVEILDVMAEYEAELGRCLLATLNGHGLVVSEELKALRPKARSAGGSKAKIDADDRLLVASASGNNTTDAEGKEIGPPTRQTVLAHMERDRYRRENLNTYIRLLKEVAAETPNVR